MMVVSVVVHVQAHVLLALFLKMAVNSLLMKTYASPAAHVQAAALLVLSLMLKSGSARKSASACFPCSFIPAGERLVNA